MNPQEIKIFDCSVIELSKINTHNGRLAVVEKHVPFPIQRVFYLYDIPAGESRGAHAHKECHQFLVAASGSFEVVLEDGQASRTIFLNQPHFGLHIPPGIWAHEQNFSSGAICLVLASHGYDESDYIRNYEDFKHYRGIR